MKAIIETSKIVTQLDNCVAISYTYVELPMPVLISLKDDRLTVVLILL